MATQSLPLLFLPPDLGRSSRRDRSSVARHTQKLHTQKKRLASVRSYQETKRQAEENAAKESMSSSNQVNQLGSHGSLALPCRCHPTSEEAQALTSIQKPYSSIPRPRSTVLQGTSPPKPCMDVILTPLTEPTPPTPGDSMGEGYFSVLHSNPYEGHLNPPPSPSPTSATPRSDAILLNNRERWVGLCPMCTARYVRKSGPPRPCSLGESNQTQASFLGEGSQTCVNRLGSGFLDPFTLSSRALTPRIKFLLYNYVQCVIPLAHSIIGEWDWISMLSFIQASPQLQYAISAFCSAFLEGAAKGSPAIVLPPPIDSSQTDQPLWPYPEWFIYQTKCITLINAELADPTERESPATFHSILFLLRLAVLRCERTEADFHFKALTALSNSQVQHMSFHNEYSVVIINLITAFYDRPLVLTTTQTSPTGEVYPFLDLNYAHPSCAAPSRFPLLMAGRRLTWRSTLSPDCREVDPILVSDMLVDKPLLSSPSSLPKNVDADLRTCIRISIVIFAYLTGLSYDTSLPRIRQPLLHEFYLLKCSGPHFLWKVAPRVTFWILTIGAYASFGQPERRWFVKKLALQSAALGVETWDDAQGILDNFFNIVWTHDLLFKGIWAEVVECRRRVRQIEGCNQPSVPDYSEVIQAARDMDFF